MSEPAEKGFEYGVRIELRVYAEGPTEAAMKALEAVRAKSKTLHVYACEVTRNPRVGHYDEVDGKLGQIDMGRGPREL